MKRMKIQIFTSITEWLTGHAKWLLALATDLQRELHANATVKTNRLISQIFVGRRNHLLESFLCY